MKFTDLKPKDVYDLFCAWVPALGYSLINFEHCIEIMHFGYTFKGEDNCNFISIAQPVASTPLARDIYLYHLKTKLIDFLVSHESITLVDLIAHLLSSLQEIEKGMYNRYKETLPSDYVDGGETEHMKPYNFVVSDKYSEALTPLSLVFDATVVDSESKVKFAFGSLYQATVTIKEYKLSDLHSMEAISPSNLASMREQILFHSGELLYSKDLDDPSDKISLHRWIEDKTNDTEFIKVYRYVKEAM